MQSFTNLIAWQKAVELAKEVYEVSKKFPKDERYAMTQQIRKSSASVMANIAEGHGRYTFADRSNKYVIARGELSETKAFLLLAVAVRLVSDSEIANAIALADETGKLLSGLINACDRKSSL